MKFDKIVISPREKGLLVSLGIIIFGNIAKPKCRDVGSFIQGIGLGIGAGTVMHHIDERHPSRLPHHDITALISLPIVFVADKANIIANKDIANNLYGIGLGVLSEHLLAEGCSFCGTSYCRRGESLC